MNGFRLNQDHVDKPAFSPRPRPGRPRADQAGEVNKRIIDAATAIFLSHGFGRTTLDEVAEQAHVGKASLYRRFPTKDVLFEAVVRECVETFLSDMEVIAVDGSLEERINRTGNALAEATLTPYVISIMRITLAETVKFPEVARQAFRLGFGSCVQSIVDAATCGHDSLARSVAITLGERFVQMALHPLYFHAFGGDDLESLRLRAPSDIAQVARMLIHDGALDRPA